MNHRHRAIIAVVIAVGLFGAPLVSPVPNYDAHLQMDAEPINSSTMEEKEKQIGNLTPVRYQNLSTPAQRFFDRANKANGSNERLQHAFPKTVAGAVNKDNGGDDIIVPFDEVPKPWSTSLSESGGRIVSVHKDGQYYLMDIYRRTPGPSFQAFMLRLGPLLGAIGFGTLAGYFTLTTED